LDLTYAMLLLNLLFSLILKYSKKIETLRTRPNIARRRTFSFGKKINMLVLF